MFFFSKKFSIIFVFCFGNSGYSPYVFLLCKKGEGIFIYF